MGCPCRLRINEFSVSILDAASIHRQVQVRFDELPAGTDAVSMYHDENDDKKFNKGLFGRPKEGYAVSNNIVHAHPRAEVQ